jgi:ketosteroid isomerase-like protein
MTAPDRHCPPIRHPEAIMSTFDLAQHNKALMKEIFQGVGQGDPRLFYSHLAHDASLTITGQYSWSQVVVGKERIAKDLYGYVRSRLAERGKTHAYHFLADGDWVVVEARGDMVTRSGAPYQNDYCLLYRLQDDLIVEIKEYEDSVLCERLLGAYPQK